jgi:multidrug efflux system membrane fusion protein
MRPVTVELTQNNSATIANGIAAGDTVVVDGQDKLKEGSLVDPHQSGGNRNAQSPASASGAS